MPSFTLGQRKAHDHQRHVSITANAGSGKTSVLVSRYCDLLEFRGYHPVDVAAITFTEKAASELRSRIAREIESRLDDAEHRENWERLKQIREQFPASVVTTIHGFCGQILREYPIDFEVSPTYSVISGFERTEMVEASLMEAVEAALQDEPDARFIDAYDTFRRVGREKAESIVRLLMRERESLALMRQPDGVLGKSTEERIDQWIRHIDRAARSSTLNADTRPALEILIALMKPEPRATCEKLLTIAEKSTDLSDYLTTLTELFSLILIKSGSPRKANFERETLEQGDLDQTAKVLKDSLRRAEQLLASDSSVEIHEILLRDSEVLLTVADEAIRRYAARKERIGGLDFEDLQLRLYAGLQKEEVRERVEDRFRYIMVDEFQDTNQLQYQLVRAMAGNLVGPDLLCIVGDQKQSIYGFRGAEVEVFSEATDEMRRVNRDAGRGDVPLIFRHDSIPADTREEGLGEIALSASFRLLPGICAFVNTVCAPIMRGGAGPGGGVEYEPLVAARRSEGRGIVEFILATDPKRTESEEESIPEAELIARRIVSLVQGGERVVWSRGDDGVERPREAAYSDIALLCRKRSTFDDLERACRAHGIPYITHGSAGYFGTQEVFDVVNYLRTLLNYRNDVALLGLLRSPFFAVSDVELFRIGNDREGLSPGSDLWERVTNRVDRGRSSEELSRAVTILRDDQSMASRVPVSLLLKRIVERTGWRGAVSGTERGDQALANVDKLIELAREFEGRGFTNLFDFVERVTSQIDMEETESEAEIGSSRDAVRIMTMHGAKGLEFPIVILPSLESPPRKSTPPFLDKELGPGWDWTYNQESFQPSITAVMSARSADREQAEEARLFYVALTRARDMLILSGTVGEEPRSGSMLAWGLEPVRRGVDGGDRLPVQKLQFLEADGESTTSKEWSQQIAVRRELPLPVQREAEIAVAEKLESSLVQIGEVPARARGEIYSATQFLVYTQCPTRYYLRYRLGIPETIQSAYSIDEEEADSEDGSTIARMFRLSVSNIDALQNEEELAGMLDEVLLLEAIEEGARMKVRERVLELLTPLITRDDLGALIGLRQEEISTSLELRAPVPYDGAAEYLLGVLDRVFPGKDGVRYVQFKTLRLRERDAEAIAESYRPQMRLYAWLLSELYPDQRAFTGMILFADQPDSSYEFTFSRFDLLRAAEEFRAIIEDIRSISYSARRDLPLATDHCQICPYFVESNCLLAGNSPDTD